VRVYRRLIYWALRAWTWKWFIAATVASIVFIVWLGLIQPRLECQWANGPNAWQETQFCYPK
jgi:hypothetical protein